MAKTTADEVCTFLAWDSAFFERRIAQVTRRRVTQSDLSRILAWRKANSIDCLYFLADPDDPVTVALAEQNGFRLVDIRLTLVRNLSGPLSLSDPGSSTMVRPFAPPDLTRLLPIARKSHTASRFFFDSNFPRASCEALYEVWLNKSCGISFPASVDGGEVDAVIGGGRPGIVWVAEFDERVVGYISCQLDKETAQGKIGLLGVELSAQGHGVGLALVWRSLRWFHDEGASSVSVVTQARNVRAQRLYERCGFLSCSIQLWYHRWFSP